MNSIYSLTTILLLSIASDVLSKHQVICYITSWNTNVVDKIDTNLCSTFIVAFGKIAANGTIEVPSNMKKFLKLKTPTSKLMLALGGGKADLSIWSIVSSDALLRTFFAQNCLKICKQYKLDGIDIDWEFPSTTERENFVELHKAVFYLLHPSHLSLTTAVGTGYWIVEVKNVYDFQRLNNYVDGYNMMTYDMHMDQIWDINNGVNFNAPKYAEVGDSIEKGIRSLLNKNVPARKMFIGLPFFSRMYRLQNIELNTPGSPFVPGYQKLYPLKYVPAYNKVSTINEPSLKSEHCIYSSVFVTVLYQTNRFYLE